MLVLTGVCVVEGKRVHLGEGASGSASSGAGHGSFEAVALSKCLDVSIEANWQVKGSVGSAVPVMARIGRRSFSFSDCQRRPATSPIAAMVFPRSAHSR